MDMDIEASPSSKADEMSSTAQMCINYPSEQELAEFPALRPPIKGKRARISDEPGCTYVSPNKVLPPPPEVLTDKEEHKVSSKRKKGKAGTDWGQAELYSSVTPQDPRNSLVDRVVDKVLAQLKGTVIDRPEEKQFSQPLSDKKAPVAKLKSQRVPPLATPQSVENGPLPKNKVSEARKDRKKEKRRQKRQEEARRRSEGLPEGKKKDSPGRAQQRPEVNLGPASGTRSRLRQTTENGRPSAIKEVIIRDVSIPPKEWTTVGKGGRPMRTDRPKSGDRGETYAKAVAKHPPPPASSSSGQSSRGGASRIPTQQQQQRQPVTIKRPPKTAAVQISCPPGKCGEAMRLAKERMDFRGLGIKDLRPRRARTGALLLEIPGAEGAAKADALEMKEALKDQEGVKISRPVKTAELRLKDLEDSISAVEIANMIADEGECVPDEIRVGPIRQGLNRLGTAWVRCPMITANRLLRKGRLTLGWTRVRIELLPERTTTCYLCLQPGHVRATCPGGKDRAGLCYRCGEAGHLASTCSAPPRCPVCADLGRPDGHRVGGRACRAPRKRERRGGKAGGGDNTRSPPPPTEKDTRTRQGPEPMEVVTGPQPRQEPEPMEFEMVAEPTPAPPQPSRPDWPVDGGGWSQAPSPPSQPIEWVNEGGNATPLLQHSRPIGPVIVEERELRPEERLKIRRVPVVHLMKVDGIRAGPFGAPPTGKQTIELREVVDEEESSLAPPDADRGDNVQKESMEVAPITEEEARPIGVPGGDGSPDKVN